jgi:hypothetical protein
VWTMGAATCRQQVPGIGAAVADNEMSSPVGLKVSWTVWTMGAATRRQQVPGIGVLLLTM